MSDYSLDDLKKEFEAIEDEYFAEFSDIEIEELVHQVHDSHFNMSNAFLVLQKILDHGKYCSSTPLLDPDVIFFADDEESSNSNQLSPKASELYDKIFALNELIDANTVLLQELYYAVKDKFKATPSIEPLASPARRFSM